MSDPVDVKTLGRHIREHRASCGLSLRAAADEADVPFNTLARAERGHPPDLANFARLVKWAGRDPAEYLRTTSRVRAGSTTAAVRDLLHADAALTGPAAEQIAGLVDQLYGALAAAPATGVVHLHATATFVPEAAELLAALMGRMEEAVRTRIRSLV